VLGTAFEFYGNHYVHVWDSDILDTDSSMTISLWIKPDSFASNGSKFMCKWYSSPQQGDWLFSTSSRDSCEKYLGWHAVFANYGVYGRDQGYIGSGNVDTSNFLKKGQWNHIAVSFDTGYVKSYYNGALVKQDTSHLKYTSLNEYGTDDIYIGRYRKNYPNYYFFGSLDEIRIYNRALTDKEIYNLYQQATGVERPTYSTLRQNIHLQQNYPNPFNPRTVIRYQSSVTSHIDLSIYNILGQKVTTLVSERKQPGTHNVEWDASGCNSGVYFYRLETNKGFVQTKKLMLVR
jgi:hypothetical protein